ncbi:LRRC1 [Symbiodinium sp. CCMP2592]|nr:LRRC1 [Symbiodinium sp. CCMP2592]
MEASEYRCSGCDCTLNPSKWAQIVVPGCLHAYHLSCALQASQPRKLGAEAPGETSPRRDCERCTEFLSSETNGVRLLYNECSEELHRRDPTDIEFVRTFEIKHGRELLPLHEIPASILQLQGLRCLDFSGHPLVRVPPEIKLLKSLSRLCFVSTQITELPEELCELQNLQQFLMSCNPLRRLPESLCKLVRLWDFYFDGNQLEELPQQYPPLVNGLKVSGNLLRQIPEAVGGLPDIKCVRAYANKLEALPDGICQLTRTTEMSLQGNRLEQLPRQFGSLQNLQYLSLHDNFLRALPDSILELSELRWLYIYNNRLQSLPHGLTTRLQNLERLLVEANPLSEATVADLVHQGSYLRVLGLDVEQASKISSESLPPFASVGWMLPWHRLYAKLQPASQLKRRQGVEAVRGHLPTTPANDVLVVAFAASQAEPEWLGVLSQVYSGDVSIAEAELQISMDDMGKFSSIFRKLHGQDLQEGEADIERLASACWLSAPAAHSGIRQNGEVLQDFDVLTLCDTGAQWYTDVTEREHLELERRLREFVPRYKRVVLLGVSMGGFGALSNSHLATSVLVFGPQTDLTVSHLRPGFSPEDLVRMSDNLRSRVQQALSQGVHFQYHVAAEDHLAYARRLPLPRSCFVVHPVEGRIARLLERAGILWPVLVRSIAREQRLARGEVERPAVVYEEVPVGTLHAWQLEEKEETVPLGLWGYGGKLCICRISPLHLCQICRFPPRAGDWFCSTCLAHNVGKAKACRKCSDSSQAGVVAKAWRKEDLRPSAKKLAHLQSSSTVPPSGERLSWLLPLRSRFVRLGAVLKGNAGSFLVILIAWLLAQLLQRRRVLR